MGCTYSSPSDGPSYPAETYDDRSSGNVYSQSRPVKHTRLRYDGGYYTDDPVDDGYIQQVSMLNVELREHKKAVSVVKAEYR